MQMSDWAQRWGVPDAALIELRAVLMGQHPVPRADGVPARSEAAVQAAIRVKASLYGFRLWRNNVGVLRDDAGVPVRFGLANDSHMVNAVCKSGDLIGCRPRVVQPDDIGKTIGQFVSFEVKRSDWRYTGTEREKAQANWAALILSLGGDARFVTDENQV